MPTDYKKYLPFLVIGGVAIWAILKLSKSGSVGQVVNRVIPVSEPNDSTALAQIQAQFELGKMQIAAGSELAGKQVDAERQRLEFANRALEIQGNYGLEGLKIESAKAANQAQLQSELSKIALDSQNYDTQLRANAASELLRQQRSSANNNALLQLGGLLANLLKGNQSQSKPSASGGSSPSVSSPPFNPNARRTTSSATSALTNALARFFGDPYGQIAQPTYDSLGYASGYDLQPYYDAEVQAYDNWLNFVPAPTGANIYSDFPTFGGSSDDYFSGSEGSIEAYDFYGFAFE